MFEPVRIREWMFMAYGLARGILSAKALILLKAETEGMCLGLYTNTK